MERDNPSPLDQISPSDWEDTPEKVKKILELLLSNSTLSEGENRLIQFLDATPIGIIVHDLMGQIVYINSVGRMLVGIDSLSQLNPSQFAGVFQVYHEGTQLPYAVESLPTTRALAGETVWIDDLEIHHGDRVTPLGVWATPIFDNQGQVMYAITAFQDISDLKHRELEQQILENTLKREEHYGQVIQVQTALILRSQPDTTIVYANDALCATIGRTFADVVGETWSCFVPPEDLDTVDKMIAGLTPKKPTYENISRDHRANGQVGWTQWINLGIFDDQDRLVEIQSVGRDITALQEQIQREQALNRVFQAIRNSLDLDTIFATAASETAQILSRVNCRVAQYLPESGIWRIVAEFRHNPDALSALGLEIADEDNPVAAQLKQLKIVRVENTSNLEDKINQEISQSFPGAWALIPLVVDGSLWGSFSISTAQRPYVWQNEQIELAKAVADQLEVAIQQANLYHQVQSELAERRRVEAALRESEARFRNIAANVPGAIIRYLLRPDGSDSVLYMSPGCYRLWEVDAQHAEADGKVMWQMVHPEDLPGMRQSMEASARDLSAWTWQWRITTPSGHVRWLEVTAQPVSQPDNCIVWDGLILDVTDRKQAEIALRESEARYRLLAENMNDLVCLHSLNGRYLYISPSCESLLGYGYDEMLGQDVFSFIHPKDRDLVCKETYTAAASGKTTLITYRMRQKSGQYIWFETLAKPILDATGQTVQLQTTSRDVTERIQVQNQLKHDALHDALTGLPNRHLFMERLELAINRAKRFDDYHFSIVFLDLDRFKVVNDSLGHIAGDRLLIAIAQKLQDTLRSTDLAARLGGDEFVILLEEVKDIQEAVRATERVFEQFQEPLLIEGRAVYTSASAGIVLGAREYVQASYLLRDADIAMYRAKSKGKNRYEVFDTEMHTQALNRLHLENDLRHAKERNEFALYYQPILALDTKQLVGFEALIRWNHPTQGLKSPNEFISVAEEIGLITSLDYSTLYIACKQLAAWQREFPDFADLKVSVNLSAQDLQQPCFLENVDSVLAETRLNGASLTLEITESMLIEDVESTINLLSQLKEREIRISIDDFGTGYSSLSYLHRLPVDSLKVDHTFVNQMQNGNKNHQIVETIVALSHRLEIDAIAEGIETQQQLQQLQQLGYAFGQGHLFSKPLSHDAVKTLLASRMCMHVKC